MKPSAVCWLPDSMLQMSGKTRLGVDSTRKPVAVSGQDRVSIPPLIDTMMVGGGAVPVPLRRMLKGCSSPSLLAMWRVAILTPELTGAKRTLKVVLPPGPLSGALGLAVTENNALSTPSIVMPKPVRSALPKLRSVKTRSAVLFGATLPKSFVPPARRSVPEGCSTAISGAGACGVKLWLQYPPVRE